jgi:hypothetical protein
LHRSAPNRARPPARVPAKARPIAGDGQAVRWLRSTDGHPSEHSERAPQPPRPSGYATLSGDGSRVVRIGGGALPACCRWMVPSTRI